MLTITLSLSLSRTPAVARPLPGGPRRVSLLPEPGTWGVQPGHGPDPRGAIDRWIPLQSRCYLWAMVTTVLTLALAM